MHHHIPLLNDDVLREVVDYLHGSDALSVSLTSKHVYELAFHRISAVIECKCREKLRLLHRTMVHDNPWQAEHIRELIIRETVFTFDELNPRVSFSSDSSDDDSDSESGSYSKPAPLPVAVEPPVAPLVVGLLRVASQICSLAIDRFDVLGLTSDSGILRTFAAQTQLSRLEISGVRSRHFLAEHNRDIGMSPFFQPSWCHLARLSLEFSKPFDDDYLLLDIVAAFPRLRTLRLIRFRPRNSFLAPRYAWSTTPLLSSIRKFILENATPSSLDLVSLYPNLSLVSIGIRDLI